MMLVPDKNNDFFENENFEDEFLLFNDMQFAKKKYKHKTSTCVFIGIYLFLAGITFLSIMVHLTLSGDVFLEYLSDKLHKGLIITNLIFAIAVLPYQIINLCIQVNRSWRQLQ